MKLTKNCFKYSLLIVGLTSSLSSFAEPVNWKLSFVDETGKEVGTGQFSYDPDTTEDITVSEKDKTHLFGGRIKHPIDAPTETGMVNGIDSISVKLLGEIYSDELSRIPFDPYIGLIPSFRVLGNAWWDNTAGSQIMGIIEDPFYDELIYPNLSRGVTNPIDISVSEMWTLWGAQETWRDEVFSYNSDKMLDFSMKELMNSGEFRGSWTLSTYEESYPDDHYYITEENSGIVTATRVMENHSCDSALYTPNKGEISINTLDINGKPYNVVLKKTGGYDFTITKISRDRSDSACQQAEYISNKGIIDIPMLDINGKHYKVMMKKKGGYDFEIKQISRIR